MLRCTRPLLAEVAPAGGLAAAAAAAGISGAAGSGATDRDSRGSKRGGGGGRVRPLGERYDSAGYPRKSLNIKYSSLVVGQHFATAVVDKRTQLMALLSACNLIREVIAQEGRILITCKDPELEGELLAAARDCGEFTHFGKWPPGGFTNRPQVMVVPRLPSLVISMEHDNHVLMREAFQMCIPRVAPVDVYNNKADATPEVPLQATQLSVAEKKRMLTFFSSFIAKLKYGQMPVGDTQSRFKEYVASALSTYQKSARDVPEPYVKAATRLYDERPDIKYGLDPRHTVHNEKRAFEESAHYRVGALQPRTYRDAAETEDDVMADRPPSVEEWDVNDVTDYAELSDPIVDTPDDLTGAGYVHQLMPDGQMLRVGAEAGQRDFEQEEATALARAARDSGSVISTSQSHTDRPSQVAISRGMLAMQKRMERSTVPEVNEEYERWLKERQDEANDLIPYADQTEPELSKSTWATPGEDKVQARLFRLKNRVRELHSAKKAEEAESHVPVAAPVSNSNSKRRLLRPKRTASGLENTPFDPSTVTSATDRDAVYNGMTEKELLDSRRTGSQRRTFQENVGELWDDEMQGTVDGWDIQPIVPIKKEGSGNSASSSGTGSAASGSKGPVGESRRGFSTSTRRFAKAASTSAPVAAKPAAAGAGAAGEQKPRFSFPRWMLPAFLLAPIAAYIGASRHADEDDVNRVREQQSETLHGLKSSLGLAESSLSPSRRSALVAELSSKESSLSLLVQTYAALLENVSPAERANHKAIFDEFEQTKDELEKEIAAIKKQIA